MNPGELDDALDEDRRDRGPGRRSDDPLKNLAKALNDVAEEEARLRAEGSDNFRAYRSRQKWAWALVVLSVIAGAYYVTADIRRASDDRRAAVTTLCAATSAVIDAGRATITAGGAISPELDRNLRPLGLPPREVREARAQEAARQYGQAIAERVQRAADVDNVVTTTGRLRCDVLVEAVTRR